MVVQHQYRRLVVDRRHLVDHQVQALVDIQVIALVDRQLRREDLLQLPLLHTI